MGSLYCLAVLTIIDIFLIDLVGLKTKKPVNHCIYGLVSLLKPPLRPGDCPSQLVTKSIMHQLFTKNFFGVVTKLYTGSGFQQSLTDTKIVFCKA
jgi:hypothetical protein